jgi:hypothetical protein
LTVATLATLVAPRKDIRPSDAITVCDVCGRTLLRGETADPYLHGGERRLVCELCRGRAVSGGWIPEDESLGPRAQWGANERRRSLIGRLRGRRERPSHPPPEEDPWAPDWGEGPAEEEASEPEPAPEPELDPEPPPPPTPRRPPREQPVAGERHVHAVPASDEMKRVRALELFNVSEHPRTVAGIARSLGPPTVAVHNAGPDRSSVVTIVVAWELSWYRYEVDLADEANGVRVAEQGAELEELPEDDRGANAAADDGGLLALAS